MRCIREDERDGGGGSLCKRQISQGKMKYLGSTRGAVMMERAVDER